MRAIFTQYYSPTTHRDAKIIAWTHGSTEKQFRATVTCNQSEIMNEEDEKALHRKAAESLVETMDWPGALTLQGASTYRGYVFVFPGLNIEQRATLSPDEA